MWSDKILVKILDLWILACQTAQTKGKMYVTKSLSETACPIKGAQVDTDKMPNARITILPKTKVQEHLKIVQYFGCKKIRT